MQCCIMEVKLDRKGKGNWNTGLQWRITVLNPVNLTDILFEDNFRTLREIHEALPNVVTYIKLKDFSRGHTKVPNYIKLEHINAADAA